MASEQALSIQGVKDRSPAGNAVDAHVRVQTVSPVFSRSSISGKTEEIRDVANLPVRGSDAWTINLFVRVKKLGCFTKLTASQPIFPS